MGARRREASDCIAIVRTFVAFVLRLLLILFIKHACIVITTVSGVRSVSEERESTFLCMLLGVKTGWMFHVADRQQG